MKSKGWMLHNSFHGRRVHIRTLENGIVSECRAKRLRQRLCGQVGCECHCNALGMAGPQTCWIEAGPVQGWFRIVDLDNEENAGKEVQPGVATTPSRARCGPPAAR